jgi:transposase-like protein
MTIPEIAQSFPTELHAVEHFEAARWVGPPRCAYCDADKLSKRTKDHRFNCKSCGKTSSVTVGTTLHRTKIDLRNWLFAFGIVADAKKGLSALQLQRNLGISYPTAWAMYHKIRDMMAMENAEMEPLDDIVEMDETFVGGKPRRPNVVRLSRGERAELNQAISDVREQGYDLSPIKGNPALPDLEAKRGRGTSKIPVVGIVQRDGSVVAEVMQSLTYVNLRDMVKRHVETDDALLITDAYKGYSRFDRIMEHIMLDHKAAYSYDGVNTNTIESFWAIIKRGIIGQYHQVSPKHLPRYVAEFVFKYNNRHDDDMFETLVKKAITPLTL